MRAFISAHVTVWRLSELCLDLIYKTADRGFRYLSIGNGAIGSKLSVDSSGGHPRITAFQITDLFLQVVIQLPAHAGIRPGFWDQCVKAIHTTFGDKKALAYLYRLTLETQRLEQLVKAVVELTKELLQWCRK